MSTLSNCSLISQFLVKSVPCTILEIKIELSVPLGVAAARQSSDKNALVRAGSEKVVSVIPSLAEIGRAHLKPRDHHHT